MQPTAGQPRPMEQWRFPYGKLSDLDLVARAKGGDERALAALVDRHSPRVHRLTAQLVEDFEDARDAAQESLVKVCVRLRQFRGDALFTTWLHRLVVNTCRDLVARQRLRRADALEPADRPAGEEVDPSRLAQLGDLRRDLADALGRVSAEQRLVVVCRDALGMSYEEIARTVRMPVGTVKSYVHRGRQRLRARLEEHAPS